MVAAQTPLLAAHRALGARIVPFAGYEMPLQYAGIVREHHAVRTAAGLFDVAHMGRLEVQGAEALATVDSLLTNDVAALPVGKALYTVCCNERGTIVDDLIVYRIAEEKLWIVCNAGNRAPIAERFAMAAELHGCGFVDQTDETALLALQGPRAPDILAAVGSRRAVDLRPFHVTEETIAGIPTRIARTGYTGEDGFELSCASERAVELWKALLDTGEPMGAQPIGLGARDTLRLEAALCLYGNEIDETTDPFEAGLGWVVKLDRSDFVGREALIRIKKDGQRRKLVGLEMVGRGVARHGYAIVDAAGAPIGTITSGCPSPTLGKNIALGYVPVEESALGNRLTVDIRGKLVEALVVKTPFYRRPKPAPQANPS